jgi:tol-pal system protein YbgF
MTCDEVREAFSELYDDMLTGARLMDVTQHLDGCSDCRAEWEALTQSLQLVTRLGKADPPPGFAARVREQAESPPWWMRLTRTLFVPLRVKVPIHAVALAAVSFAGMMLFQRSPELRRAVEVTPPRPVARQASPSKSQAPVPPVPEESARAQKRGTAPKAPSTAARGEGGAAPPAASPPPALMKQKRAPSSRQEKGAEPKKAPVPKAPERAAGPSAENQALPEDIRLPAPRPRPAAPPRAESRETTGNLTAAIPAAPAGPEQLSSIPKRSADELFSGAATEFAQQDYARAIEGFRTFVATYPQDARVSDARFLVGEALFSQQRYAEAIPEFETLIRQYPGSRRVPAALSRQGQARLALGDRTGCQVLREVVTRYPQAREATSARETLSARCP